MKINKLSLIVFSVALIVFMSGGVVYYIYSSETYVNTGEYDCAVDFFCVNEDGYYNLTIWRGSGVNTNIVGWGIFNDTDKLVASGDLPSQSGMNRKITSNDYSVVWYDKNDNGWYDEYDFIHIYSPMDSMFEMVFKLINKNNNEAYSKISFEYLSMEKMDDVFVAKVNGKVNVYGYDPKSMEWGFLDSNRNVIFKKYLPHLSNQTSNYLNNTITWIDFQPVGVVGIGDQFIIDVSPDLSYQYFFLFSPGNGLFVSITEMS